MLETLFLKGLPVFQDQPFSNLLPLLNSPFSEDTKNEILDILSQMVFTDKEAATLLRFMKANPALSMDLLYRLLDQNNASFASIALDHLIFLKTTKHPLIHDKMFEPLWLNVLQAFNSHELIPFYKDREWVRSIYGIDAEIKTKEWAKGLIKEKLIKKEHLLDAKEILSRTRLKHPPILQLKTYLEPLSHEKLDTKEKISSLFHYIVSMTLLAINQEDEYQLHYIQIIFRLFKLGIASRLHSTNCFILMEQVYDRIPLLSYEGGSFNPMAHLIQTLPLIDFGTEKIYNDWNEKKVELFNKCSSGETLSILPYATVQASCKFSNQFKLITEQYIENKATKAAFQKDLDYLFQSAQTTFESIKLQAHEDPALICIEDLSHYLRTKANRERAYDAFHYILSKYSNSPVHLNQYDYLEVRKTAEDLIVTGLKQIELKKTVRFLFFHSINLFMESLIEAELKNLHKQDPIADALELDAIPLIERLDLRRLWQSNLKKSTQACDLYELKKMQSYTAHELKSLTKIVVETHLKNRILSLKATREFLNEQSFLTEIALILNSASLHLQTDDAEAIRTYLEKTLSVKVPMYLFQDDSEWIHIT